MTECLLCVRHNAADLSIFLSVLWTKDETVTLGQGSLLPQEPQDLQDSQGAQDPPSICMDVHPWAELWTAWLLFREAICLIFKTVSLCISS